MSAPTQRLGLTRVFSVDAPDPVVEWTLVDALETWKASGYSLAEIVKIERLDPPTFRGEPLGFSEFGPDGEVVEIPPMRAWRIEGLR